MPSDAFIRHFGGQASAIVFAVSMDTFKQLVGKMEKVCFSSGSESRDIIRRADLLRKRSRRGGVCERPLTIGYCTDRWMTEDRVVNLLVARRVCGCYEKA